MDDLRDFTYVLFDADPTQQHLATEATVNEIGTLRVAYCQACRQAWPCASALRQAAAYAARKAERDDR